MIRVLSFGGGIQSVCLLLMSHVGEIDPIDFIVFADTGWEPESVYSYLDYLVELGIKIDTVSWGSIREDLLAAGRGERKFTSIPGFVEEGGKGRIIPRQCTMDYKIRPIRRFCTKKLKETKTPKKLGSVELWLGISSDEYLRAKPSQVQYIKHRHPLLEQKMSRDDCIAWIESHGFKMPSKSACIGCPFRSSENWSVLTEKEKEDVILIDKSIRKIGRLNGEFFLNKKLMPMDKFFLELEVKKEVNHFINECEGHCGL